MRIRLTYNCPAFFFISNVNSFISRGKNQIGILLVYSVETGK